MTSPSRLLAARDVAVRFGVSVETVLRWYRRGLLPGVRLASNVLRFDEADVAAFVAERSGRGNAQSRALTPAGDDPNSPFARYHGERTRRPQGVGEQSQQPKGGPHGGL